jgi:hypothetical protein
MARFGSMLGEFLPFLTCVVSSERSEIPRKQVQRLHHTDDGHGNEDNDNYFGGESRRRYLALSNGGNFLDVTK